MLRVRRMLADLDFRARVAPGPEAVIPLAATDPAGARAPRRRDPRPLLPPEHRRRPDRHRMRYPLRYHAEYRYSGPVFDQHNVLRVTPATTPLQRVRGFRVVVEPSARTRTYRDYFGTEVVEFNVPGRARAAHDHGRGRGRHRGAERAAATATGSSPSADAYTGRGGEFLLRRGRRARQRRLSRRCARRSPRTRRAETLERLCEVIPDRFEYQPGRHLRRLDGRRPARGRRGRLPGLRPPLADPPARRGHRGALRVGLPVRRLPRTGARTPSRSTRTPGWRRSCPAPTAASPSGSGADPTNRTAGRRRAREDRPRALLRRRRADPGRLPRGRRRGRPRGQRAHDPPHFIK